MRKKWLGKLEWCYLSCDIETNVQTVIFGLVKSICDTVAKIYLFTIVNWAPWKCYLYIIAKLVIIVGDVVKCIIIGIIWLDRCQIVVFDLLRFWPLFLHFLPCSCSLNTKRYSFHPSVIFGFFHNFQLKKIKPCCKFVPNVCFVYFFLHANYIKWSKTVSLQPEWKRIPF